MSSLDPRPQVRRGRGIATSRHVTERIRKAKLAFCTIPNPRCLSLNTALRLFDLKIVPIATYGIKLTWNLLKAHHLEQRFPKCGPGPTWWAQKQFSGGPEPAEKCGVNQIAKNSDGNHFYPVAAPGSHFYDARFSPVWTPVSLEGF